MEIPDPEPVPFAEQNAVHEGVVQHWNPGGDVAEQINGGDTPTPAKPPLRDISIGDICRYCGPPGGVNVSCWGRDLHVLDSSHRYSHPPSASNEAAPMSIDLKKVWVTTAQAACALGISTKTLSRCCNEGCFKLGKHYRIVSGSNPLNSRYRWHHDRCVKLRMYLDTMTHLRRRQTHIQPKLQRPYRPTMAQVVGGKRNLCPAAKVVAQSFPQIATAPCRYLGNGFGQKSGY
jgi:hypothetical protein